MASIQQAVVVKRNNLNPNQSSTQLALFNVDGTPFKAGSGGSCDCEDKVQSLEGRLDVLEGLLNDVESDEAPESSDD